MKYMKKKLSLALAMMLVVALVAGCGGGATTEQKPAEGTSGTEAASGGVLKIGGIGPLTGETAVYGNSNKQGAELAFAEVNAAGGLLGKTIEFKTSDDKNDTTEAINAYNKMVSDGAVALLGPVTTKPTLAVADLAGQDNFPMITATATGAEVTDYGDNAFRVCFIDPYQGEVLATFANETLAAKTAAVLYNISDDYSQGIADAFKASAESKGMTVVMEGYGADDKDFKAQLTGIASKNPDVLVIPDYYTKIALIAAQAKEVGITASLIGGDGWDGVLTTVSSPDIVEGAYFCSHYSTDDPSEAVQNFIKNYKETYKEDPTSFSALAYDAAHILSDAIARAGSEDPAAIIDALQNTDYHGVTGDIQFDAKGDPIKSVSIIKIVDGKYTLDSKVTPLQ